MTAATRRGGLTTAETRLAEQYVSVLDYISRCAIAIDRGDWFYLHDKAGALAVEAERLAVIAREAYQAQPWPRAQAGEITAALPLRHAAFEVADEARRYPDWPPSRSARIYLDMRLPADRREPDEELARPPRVHRAPAPSRGQPSVVHPEETANKW